MAGPGAACADPQSLSCSSSTTGDQAGAGKQGLGVGRQARPPEGMGAGVASLQLSTGLHQLLPQVSAGVMVKRPPGTGLVGIFWFSHAGPQA